MLILILAKLETKNFRQEPNILGPVQSINTEKIQHLTLRSPQSIWQEGQLTQVENREQKKSGYDYLPKYNRNSEGGQSREGEKELARQ